MANVKNDHGNTRFFILNSVMYSNMKAMHVYRTPGISNIACIICARKKSCVTDGKQTLPTSDLERTSDKAGHCRFSTTGYELKVFLVLLWKLVNASKVRPNILTLARNRTCDKTANNVWFCHSVSGFMKCFR